MIRIVDISIGQCSAEGTFKPLFGGNPRVTFKTVFMIYQCVTCHQQGELLKSIKCLSYNCFLPNNCFFD